MPEADPVHLFLGLPARTPLGSGERLVIPRPTRACRLEVSRQSGSLLTLNFNRCWAAALNHRRAARGPMYFAMCHDDVVPAAGWADVLIGELERTGADVVSAVLPLKDARGVTSTAVQNRGTHHLRRVTVTELQRLPETFGAADLVAAGIHAGGDEVLLVNTGLWVCRFDAPWVPKFPGFRHGFDGLVVDAHTGLVVAQCFSEDWTFSRWLDRAGIKYLATRLVPAAHVGDREYRNDHAWGEWVHDLGDAAVKGSG